MVSSQTRAHPPNPIRHTSTQVDTVMSGAIDFYDLLQVIEAQQARAERFDDEGDMVDAFVACGGRADKTGHVRRETLVKVGGRVKRALRSRSYECVTT